MKVRELIQQHVLHPYGRWIIDVRHGLVVRVNVGHDRREPSLGGQLQHSVTGVKTHSCERNSRLQAVVFTSDATCSESVHKF